VILYEGQLVHKDGITFRFHGSGSLLIVRVGGNIVVSTGGDQTYFSSLWKSDDPDNRDIYSTVGDWITLEPGVPMDMEVLVGNYSGAYFSTKLLVEVKDAEYGEGRTRGPVYPIFKTAKLSRDEVDNICKDYYYGPESITNGPVFCDHKTSVAVPANRGRPEAADAAAPTNLYRSVRGWTLEDGERLTGAFVIKIGQTVTLRDPAGELASLPYEAFCAEDREFIQLARFPVFNIDFSRITSRHWEPDRRDRLKYPPSFDWTFAAKLEQRSAGRYEFELTAEVFVLGREATGSNYVLIARNTKTFVPCKANERKCRTPGGKNHLFIDWVSGKPHGVQYYGYLVTVTDKNGVVVQTRASNGWMLQYVDNIMKAQSGWYLDRTLVRTYPSGIFWEFDSNEENAASRDLPDL
jgi:hypothetical protein